MIKIKLDLHRYENSLLLKSQDIYNFIGENTEEELDLAMYIFKWVEFLNYPLTHNTKMQFDDGNFSEISGWILGFSYANHIDLYDNGNVVRIKWNKYEIELKKPFEI